MNHFKLWRRLLVALLLGLAAPWLSAIGLVPMTSTGLSSPVFVGHAGDGTHRLFIVEQGGIIQRAAAGRVGADGLPRHPHEGRSPAASGGCSASRSIRSTRRNGRFFVYYTRAGDGALVIARVRRVAPTRTSPTPPRPCC